MGMVISWGSRASLGLLAKRAKSGSLTIRVAKLLTADIMPAITPQADVEPWAVAGWWTIGPTPPARTIAQTNRAMPAVGATKALTVNKCRIFCTGTQMNGREPSQKRTKEMMQLTVPPSATALVREALCPKDGQMHVIIK